MNITTFVSGTQLSVPSGGITRMSLPKVTRITGKAFQFAGQLRTLSLPELTNIDGYAFSGGGLRKK